jgi:glycosyltransferase involved in cell wall biosynthesis
MRVALVVPGGVDRSGEYRVIPALLALIARLTREHDVHVLALHQEATPGEWPLAGARVHNIGARHTRRRALLTLAALHRRARLDVIHAIWSGSGGLVAVTAGALLGAPALIHVAGGELVALPEIGYGGALSFRSRVRERLVLRRASAVSAASAPTLARLADWGVQAERIPLGVDTDLWPPRAPQPRDPRQCAHLIHVASLNAVKDQSTLLHALAQLAAAGHAFTAEIIGEDTLSGRMQALAAQLALTERVSFRGFRPQRQLRAHLEAADLLIVSSRHETGPLVVLEAAVAGVPTVGTAVGHIAEWAPQAAVAVPVADPAALAAAIARLLEDEPRRLALARAAQRRALQEDAAHSAQAFIALYRRVTAGRPHS